MSEVPTELRDEIPSFDQAGAAHAHGPIDWSALTSIRTAKSALEIGTIVAVAAGVFWGVEGILRWAKTPSYVFPKPTEIVTALTTDFGIRYGHHLWVTAQEFLMGVAIGSTLTVDGLKFIVREADETHIVKVEIAPAEEAPKPEPSQPTLGS